MGKMGSMRRIWLISRHASQEMKTTQLIAEITRAEMMAGLLQEKVCDPACCTANTRSPELLRRLALPIKSMRVKASLEKKLDESSLGHKLVIARTVTRPNGMLSSSVLKYCPSQALGRQGTYFMLKSHRQSER